jgi:hypothetical protein
VGKKSAIQPTPAANPTTHVQAMGATQMQTICSCKVDPLSAKHKSTAGNGGCSQKKRKQQDDSDYDEPTPKSRSKQQKANLQ